MISIQHVRHAGGRGRGRRTRVTPTEAAVQCKIYGIHNCPSAVVVEGGREEGRKESQEKEEKT